MTKKTDVLPPYEVLDMSHPDKHPILRVKAKALSFPLSDEDKRDVAICEQRFDTELNMAGVAAPQIGISKQIIVFAAPDDPTLKKWRTDITQTMPKQVWINPTYEAIGENQREYYEACFSVTELAGPVKRFERVKYKAYDVDGNVIEGEAEGYLARVIQHEVEHIRGTLYIDHVPEGQLLPIAEYRERRRKAIEGEQDS
jgi:peptide deformylase